MKKQLTHISILQSSKIVTLLYVIMGLFYMIPGILMVLFAQETGTRVIGVIYCAGPIFFAIIGFIFFVIFAALYNWLAKFVGGIEVEITTTDSDQ